MNGSGSRLQPANGQTLLATIQIRAAETNCPLCGISNRRMNDPSKNQKDFFRIVSISTALGFGTLAAFLYSMKDITHDAQLVFSAGTVIVFVLAAAAGWAFWRIVRAFAERHK